MTTTRPDVIEANAEALVQARNLGWAAYRRNESPFPIQDRQLDPLTNADTIPRPRQQHGAQRHLPGLGRRLDGRPRRGEPRTDAPPTTRKGTLTITHSSTEGTLLEGSSKGDGAYEVLKAVRWAYRSWRYFPSIGAIGVRQSRDKPPTLGFIDASARALQEAGWDVEVVIDGAPRAFDDQEQARADRMDDRAEALHTKAEAKEQEANTATPPPRRSPR